MKIINVTFVWLLFVWALRASCQSVSMRKCLSIIAGYLFQLSLYISVGQESIANIRGNSQESRSVVRKYSGRAIIENVVKTYSCYEHWYGRQVVFTCTVLITVQSFIKVNTELLVLYDLRVDFNSVQQQLSWWRSILPTIWFEHCFSWSANLVIGLWKKWLSSNHLRTLNMQYG